MRSFTREVIQTFALAAFLVLFIWSTVQNYRVEGPSMEPLFVGGDHSITLPILRALGAEAPVGMIHIDAHCDTSGPFDGCKFHHGGPFRQAVLTAALDHVDGVVTIPDGPGLGVEINRQALKDFAPKEA